jgi:hypothetical protein
MYRVYKYQHLSRRPKLRHSIEQQESSESELTLQIEIQFLDPSIGAATLSPRKRDGLSERAKSNADDLWTVRFARVKALST